MTVSDLYKVLEEMVKENPQGSVYISDDWGYFESLSDVELDDDGDLVLS